MNNEVRNSLLALIMKSPDELLTAERETLGAYIEGMIGVKNIYPLATEDMQAIAAYFMDKTNA